MKEVNSESVQTNKRHCIIMKTQFDSYISNSTSLRQTPESMTAWILSFGPSDRYDNAQHASARMSVSLTNSSQDSTLRHGETCGGENNVRAGNLEALTVMTLNTDWKLDVKYCVFNYCKMCQCKSAIFILANNLCEIWRWILSPAQVW